MDRGCIASSSTRSNVLVQPMNDDAAQWLTQTSHDAYESGVEWQFFGRSLVIEPVHG